MNKFIFGDCMNPEYGLPSYPDKFFDLAVVDPPYGIGAAKVGVGEHQKKKQRTGAIKGGNWDSKIPCESYFKELKRTSKNQIIWGANYFNMSPTRGFIVWDKGKTLRGRDFAECEYAWTSFDRNSKLAYYDITAFSDSFFMERVYGKIHPTQKPIALYRWLLENYAKPGDLILDTHVGSASSLIACESLGFNYVGFEIDADYYEAAKKRMGKGIQSNLFATKNLQL